MGETFDDSNDVWQGELAIRPQRSLAFAEASSTGLTVQASDRLVFTHALDHREVSTGKLVEVGAVTVRAGEALQGILAGPRRARLGPPPPSLILPTLDEIKIERTLWLWEPWILRKELTLGRPRLITTATCALPT